LCSRKCKEGYIEAENRQIPGNATLPELLITIAFLIYVVVSVGNTGGHMS